MDRLLVKKGKNYEIWRAICQQIKTHLHVVKATIGKLGGGGIQFPYLKSSWGLLFIFADVYKDISFITRNHTTYKPKTVILVHPYVGNGF
jgi:hypothetical protein